MNTRGNQRYLETREKIQGTFQELLRTMEFEKITVAEICRRAGIHRTTFYGHYLDVLDLMDDMVREMYSDMMETFLARNELHLREGFVWLFGYIRQHQEFFRNYMILNARRRWKKQLLPDLLEERMGYILRKMGLQSREELLYYQVAFTGGLLSMISLWLENGCREDEEEMYCILRDVYTGKGFLLVLEQ